MPDFHRGKMREALLDCMVFHAGQFRKYTRRPYWEHPYEVASILIQHGIRDDSILAAALLHDTLEDTDMPAQLIRERYGMRVAMLVHDLTEVETEGNRRERKEREAHRLWEVSGDAQTIKCADLISNTKDIVPHDPGFARVYLAEKDYVLSGFKYADERLLAEAERVLSQAQAALAAT